MASPPDYSFDCFSCGLHAGNALVQRQPLAVMLTAGGIKDKRGRRAVFEQSEKVLTMYPEPLAVTLTAGGTKDKRGRGAVFEQGEKVLTMHPEDKRGRGAAFEQSEKVLTMHPEDKRGRGAAFEQSEKVLTIPEPFRSIKKALSTVLSNCPRK